MCRRCPPEPGPYPGQAAVSYTHLDVYKRQTFAFGAMLLFSVLMEADLALTLVMVAVYLFIQFYSLWWRFKLEKEM